MGNIAYVDHKPVYQVSEMLWGDLPDRQPYGRTDFRMFAVRLDSKGKPKLGGCDPDWLPLDHEWITDIRRALQIRLPANLTIWVRSDPGAADIAGADVTLSGNGKQFRGQTRSDGRFELPTLIPPGNYRITASKAGYATAEEPVAILPGGGGYAEIRLKATSEIGGIVTDHLGNPIANLIQQSLAVGPIAYRSRCNAVGGVAPDSQLKIAFLVGFPARQGTAIARRAVKGILNRALRTVDFPAGHQRGQQAEVESEQRTKDGADQEPKTCAKAVVLADKCRGAHPPVRVQRF